MPDTLRLGRWVAAALLTLTLGGLPAAPGAIAPSRDWSEAMARFASEDATLEPSPERVLFLGSSSIRGWDLEEHFPDLDALNRGFGGSTIRDSIHHFDELVTPHAPQAIVFYAGDNDVAGGMDALEVFEHFRIFTDMVREQFPETTVIFVAIKPSTLRWEMWPTMREANALIRGYSAASENLEYVDIAGPMIDPETGEPRPELFLGDGLHLNRAGYELWTSLVRPEIEAALGR